MKLIKLLPILLIVFLLTACKIPEEEKPFDPSLVEVTLVHDGNLLQLDDNVSKVDFSITHNQTKFTPSKIVWVRNLIEVQTSDTFEYTPVAGLLSKADILAQVYFFENETEYVFKTSIKTIRVNGRSAEVEIKVTNQTVNETIIENTLSDNTEKIMFKATVTGDYGNEDLSWWVIDESTNEEVRYSGFDGNDVFELLPTKPGVVRVEARIANNKFTSNKLYIDSNFGKLSLSQSINNNDVIISSSFNNDLTGTYYWEQLQSNSNEYQIITDEVSNQLIIDKSTLTNSLMIRAVFVPDSATNTIVSDSILITGQAKVVTTEAEFLQALSDKIPTIELGANIMYTNIDGPGSTKNPIVIGYPVTIDGKGFELSSLGIFVFIEVRSDNVWFKNITINHSSRYNVLVSRSVGSYFEDVKFVKPGGGSDMMTPGAGIYAMGSKVTVKNITITEAYNSGLRVEAIYQNDTLVQSSNITILGKYEYNIKELAAPIISASSKSTDATITAVGFDEFIIPIGNGKMIRRWSNDAYGVKWQLQEPYKVEYQPKNQIDFSGVVINVRIGAKESTDFGLDFVYLFLDMFKETGTIRITKPNDINNPISEYTIVDYDRTIGGDLLLYQDSNGNPIKATSPEEVGDYAVHIWVGDTTEGEGLYLGFIMIRVLPNTNETN